MEGGPTVKLLHLGGMMADNLQEQLKATIKKMFDEWSRDANSMSERRAEERLWEIHKFAKAQGLDDYLDELSIQDMTKVQEAE